MVKCAVRGCIEASANKYKPQPLKALKFYSFPKNSDVQKQWIDFCDAEKTLNLSTARVCSRHFEKKFMVKRAIDVALGLDCPPQFRNIADNAVPTLNPPPKPGAENKPQPLDRNSIAFVTRQMILDARRSASNPKTSSTHYEPPRYLFSSGTMPAKSILTLGRKPKTVPRILSKPAKGGQENPPSTNKLAKLCENLLDETDSNKQDTSNAPNEEETNIAYIEMESSISCEEQEMETVDETTPYMAFLTDCPTTSVGSFQDATILAQCSNTSRARNTSQYIILKRSIWQANEDKVQELSRRINELNVVEYNYKKAQEEIHRLNQLVLLGELADGKIGIGETFKSPIAELKEKNAALSKEVTSLRADKEKLARENCALRSDKQKLEEKFKQHAIMLKQYFTTGQLKRMFADDPMKRSRWTPEDIEQALALKTESVSAYNFLQDRYSFLLPNLATLRRWARTKKKSLEEKIASDPGKAPSEQDQALQNLIFLHDQTNEDESEVLLEENILGIDPVEIVIEL